MDEPGLLGREEQLRVLREVLDRLPEAGGALALQGGPGVGKSALLRAAADHARTAGRRILEAAGRGDDTPFSGLREVLGPVLGTVAALPAGQGAVLRSALELGSEPAPETSKVALAAFHLITTCAAERPVVLIVDDVQRLDRPTRDVVAFIARRAGDNPFVVLGAGRGVRTRAVAPVLDVPVLDEPSARRLLARHAATLSPAVRERILAEALGNPLALVELPAAWRPTGPPGSWTHLPVSPALATAFTAGLDELPARTRDALLVAAVDHVGDLAEILAAASVLAGHAVAVAQQNVPLPAVMTAYRIGVKYFWEEVVAEASRNPLVGSDTLVGAASAMWVLQDGITEAMVSGYHEAVAERLLEHEHERSAIVEALLEGRSMDADAVWSAADALGVPRKGPFTVVAAEVPHVGRHALPEIAAILSGRGIRSVWRLRPDLQLGIVCVRAPRELDDLTEVLRQHAEQRVGVSPSFDDLCLTGDALRFAKVALRGGDAGSAAVTVFDASPVAVATAGAPDVMARVAATVLGPIEALPAADRDLLLDTLDAWFACGGSTEEAAKRLYVHPNTVRLRLRRIAERTGRSIVDPRGITELSLALHALRQTPRPTDPTRTPDG